VLARLRSVEFRKLSHGSLDSMISADAPSGSRALDRMAVGESDNVRIAKSGFGNKFVGTPVLAFEESVVKGSLAGHTRRLQM
jgi:hypothetical protein